VNRCIVVTGGGTGIGRAVAAAFAASGDDVIITGRRGQVLDDTATKLGTNVRAIVCDGTDPAHIGALCARLPATVDVVVNNAGGNRDLASNSSAGLSALMDSWRANLDANVVAAALMTAALEDRLATGAALIHLGSFATDRGAGSYGAAKAALAAWNIAVARRLGRRDITSNVVSPGYIDGTEFFGNQGGEEFRRARIAETMTGRRGTPEDIAAMVTFLASPGARHITGQVLHVNGGALTTR
jgi:3-oxoacyl-[acyl-carrier protein] reductase